MSIGQYQAMNKTLKPLALGYKKLRNKGNYGENEDRREHRDSGRGALLW